MITLKQFHELPYKSQRWFWARDSDRWEILNSIFYDRRKRFPESRLNWLAESLDRQSKAHRILNRQIEINGQVPLLSKHITLKEFLELGDRSKQWFIRQTNMAWGNLQQHYDKRENKDWLKWLGNILDERGADMEKLYDEWLKLNKTPDNQPTLGAFPNE